MANDYILELLLISLDGLVSLTALFGLYGACALGPKTTTVYYYGKLQQLIMRPTLLILLYTQMCKLSKCKTKDTVEELLSIALITFVYTYQILILYSFVNLLSTGDEENFILVKNGRDELISKKIADLFKLQKKEVISKEIKKNSKTADVNKLDSVNNTV